MNLKLSLTISTILSFIAMLIAFNVFTNSLSSEGSLRIFLASVGLTIFSLMFISCTIFYLKELFFSKKR